MWDTITMLANDGKVNLADARQIWADAQDGPGVTATEKRTIEAALAQYEFTQGAKDFLAAKIATL